MLQEEYECIGISDYHNAYKMGLEYPAETEEADVVINRVSMLYEPDVIICNLQSFKRAKVNTEQEYHINYTSSLDVDMIYSEIEAHFQEFTL